MRSSKKGGTLRKRRRSYNPESSFRRHGSESSRYLRYAESPPGGTEMFIDFPGDGEMESRKRGRRRATVAMRKRKTLLEQRFGGTSPSAEPLDCVSRVSKIPCCFPSSLSCFDIFWRNEWKRRDKMGGSGTTSKSARNSRFANKSQHRASYCGSHT